MHFLDPFKIILPTDTFRLPRENDTCENYSSDEVKYEAIYNVERHTFGLDSGIFFFFGQDSTLS